MVQHRTLDLWKRETPGTSIYRIDFQASKTQFIVQKAPVWLEVPRAAESETPAVRTVWVLHHVTPERKVLPRLHYSIKNPSKMVRE